MNLLNIALTSFVLALPVSTNADNYTTELGSAKLVSCSSIGVTDPYATCFIFELGKASEFDALVALRKTQGAEDINPIGRGMQGT